MSTSDHSPDLPRPGAGGPDVPAPRPSYEIRIATDGVLARRLFAFCLDMLVIGALVILFSLAILVLGVLTLGLAWLLFAILVPAVGLLYSAMTVGGPNQATIGMRMMGLRVSRVQSTGRVDAITAAVHALLFWLATSTFFLWLLDVVVGVARDDRRMGHDLLVDVMVTRTDATP
ncbi:RDD family protein [Salinarimonas sp. NSM]|uniref:RDD family protein n=1 Tax=Salinarimonas sp. NSM TaxID=3458003 RepID=UPI004035A7E0